MIHINRSPAPDAFTKFVKKENPQDWSKDFINKHHDIYENCRSLLESDQYGLSAYTELKLDHKEKNKVHIDHFKKKDKFPELIFNWENYVVDNHERVFGCDYKDDHIKNRDDNEKLIDPIHEDPGLFFTYQFSGKMIPLQSLSDNMRARAKFTIDSFNLNYKYLQDSRADLIQIIRNYQKGKLDKSIIRDIVVSEVGLPSFVDFVLDNIPENPVE
jgi:uncharacterized protein (TIGR02646 family)